MALSDVIKNISVDVSRVAPTPTVFAKQNENSKRQVIVKLMKDGQPFTIGAGVGGYIQGATAPNPITQQSTKFKRTLTNIDTTANTASFYIAQSMTAEIGITQCEIALYDSTKPDEIICTANINIEVQGTGMSPQDEMASDDYQAIEIIKTEVTAMRDEVRTKTDQAIAAQGAAETAAQNAYNSALGVQKIVAGNEAYTKQETDLKYSVAPRKVQTSTTGELKLTDADYGLSYLELQGNSEQYTNTANINMLDVEYNKSLGLHGTDKFLRTTGEIDVSGNWSYSYYIKVTPNTLYSFVGIPASPAAAFVFYTKDKTYISGISTKDAVIDLVRAVTTPSNCEWMRISYVYTTNNPQMYLGELPLQGVYGAVDTPSPDYPSEVKSVGDIPKDSDGVEIRNIVDIEDVLVAPESEWTVTRNNIFAVPVRVDKRKINGRLFETLNPSTNLNIGLSTQNSTLTDNTNGFYLGATTAPIKGFDFSAASQVYLFIYTGSVEYQIADIKEMLKNNMQKFMFTYANEVDEYRPYIGENNCLVKIESSGVNKVDVGQKPVYDAGTDSINIITWAPQEIILDQKGGGTSYAYANVNLIVGKTYSFYCRAQVVTIEGSPTSGATTIGFRKYPPSGMMYGQTSVARDGTFHDCYSKVELPEDVSLMLYVNSTSSSGGNVRLIVKDLMVVEGEKTLQEMKALKYQPYYNQITWIPLREPLRGITGANLKLYADKIDKDGNVTQNIYFVEGRDMSSFSTDASGVNTSDSQYKWAYWVPEATIEANHDTRSVLCNMLKRGAYNVNQTVISNTGVIIFNLSNTLTGLANTETDKVTIYVAIREWVNTNNPLVYYALNKPIEYQIPAVYIETYDQETNVRCLNKVKPSSMGLDYKIAISSLIKRLEALESAAVSNGGK